MGSFGNDFIIYIREQDGYNSMFSAGELRDKLFRCLAGASVENPQDSADDITLAVEYSLLNRQKNGTGGIIDRGELDAAVIRLLEDTGFPEAAELYRHDRGFEEELVPASLEAVGDLISRRISCPEREIGLLCGSVLDAVRKLDITEASPHLYLELARHFVKSAAASRSSALPSLPQLDSEKLEALPQNVAPETAKLIKSRVITIEGLTAIFPCVRFHVSMQEFCDFFDVTSPVTELLVYPAVNQVAAAIEECRLALADDRSADIPCTLNIHDLRQFVRDGFECSDGLAAESLAAELAELFTPYTTDIFKLDYD